MPSDLPRDLPELTRDSKCPLCGYRMTDYHESHSDGESSRRSLLSNDCANRACGLPVRLWSQVAALVEAEAERDRLKGLLKEAAYYMVRYPQNEVLRKSIQTAIGT